MAIALLKLIAPQLITFLMSLIRPSETGPIGMRISILLNILLVILVIYVSEVAFAAHRASVSATAKVDSLEILTADYRDQLNTKEQRIRELELLIGPSLNTRSISNAPPPVTEPTVVKTPKAEVKPVPAPKPQRKVPEVVVDKLDFFIREREKLASDINAG